MVRARKEKVLVWKVSILVREECVIELVGSKYKWIGLKVCACIFRVLEALSLVGGNGKKTGEGPLDWGRLLDI